MEVESVEKPKIYDFDKTRGKINVQQSLMERIDGVKSTGLADEIIVEEYEGQKIDDILSFENQKQMYIPRGFAHGYLTLEENTLMQWCVDNDFCAEAAKAVRYDSDFAWQTEPWPEGEYIVSEKDRNAEKFLFAIAKTK